MTPPSTTHVRAYITARDGEPSGTKPPTLDREEETQLSHKDPPGWEDPTSIAGEPWGCPAQAAHGGPLLGGSS